MVSSALTLSPQEVKERKGLEKSLKNKKQKLATLVTQYEDLQMELDSIQHEYNVRIGSLLLQDNELDLEIIRYRNIKGLMEEGYTFEEALKHIEGYYYSEILRLQREQEKVEQERLVHATQEEVAPDVLEEIRVIWKKLIRKFHPDLVTDADEKAYREDMMKKINHAYTTRDLEALKLITSQGDRMPTASSSKESLERMLVDTENMIISVEKSVQALKTSQWFRWRSEITKGKKTGKDVFRDLESKFTDDVLTKIRLLRELKESVQPIVSPDLPPEN